MTKELINKNRIPGPDIRDFVFKRMLGMSLSSLSACWACASVNYARAKHALKNIRQMLMSMRFNYLCTYDLYGYVRNVFDAGRHIMWGSGGGVAAGNLEFCGSASAIWSPKNSRFPAPTPPPLPHIMCLPPSKTLRTGPYKSLVHKWFYSHEKPLMGGLRGPDGEGGS
jgi:hypothetical protein